MSDFTGKRVLGLPVDQMRNFPTLRKSEWLSHRQGCWIVAGTGRLGFSEKLLRNS